MRDRARNQGSVNVCTFCGSSSPDRPDSYCAHGRTAIVQGDARQAAARLWIAVQALEAHRAAFGVALDLAVKAGAASVNSCPHVESPGSNVVFLHDRDVVLPRTHVG